MTHTKTPSTSPVDQIDFSPITYTSSYDFVSFSKHKKAYLILGTILLFCFIIRAPMLVFLIGAITSWYIHAFIKHEKTKMWHRFAEANGWRIAQSGSVLTDIPPSIRHIGNKHTVNDVVAGTVFGAAFRLYDYQYTIGRGKNAKRYTNTIISMDLPADFPHILLDSKSNLGGARRIRADAEQVSLEGNFDDSFTLYVEPKHRTDALSVISPDVMQTILQATKSYDIEIVGHSVYIFAEGDKRNKTYVRDLFIGAERILAELSHRAKSFRHSSEHAATSGMKAIHMFDYELGSLRQRSWIGFLIILTIICIILFPAIISLVIHLRLT
jgi:hypothetical protein